MVSTNQRSVLVGVNQSEISISLRQPIRSQYLPDGVEEMQWFSFVSLWHHAWPPLCLYERLMISVCSVGSSVRMIVIKRSLEYLINIQTQTIPPVTQLLSSGSHSRSLLMMMMS